MSLCPRGTAIHDSAPSGLSRYKRTQLEAPWPISFLHPQPQVHSPVQAAVYLAVGIFAIKSSMPGPLHAGTLLCLARVCILVKFRLPMSSPKRAKTGRGQLSGVSQAPSTLFCFCGFSSPPPSAPGGSDHPFLLSSSAKLRQTNCRAGLCEVCGQERRRAE